MSGREEPDSGASLRILRMPEVVARTGLTARSIRRLVARGDFPPPIRLSRRTVGWLESEVEAWILARAARTRDGAG